MIDKAFVKKSFNASAGTYDGNAGLQKRLFGRLFDFADVGRLQPGRVLDVGTGTGNLALLLRQLFPAARICGCDLAQNMLCQARRKIAAHVAETPVELCAVDAEALPFIDCSFDLVVSSFTYQWLEAWNCALSEVLRVLRPGGAFVFSAFGAETFHELRSCYRQACAATGYQGGEALALPHTAGRTALTLRECGFAASAVDSFQEVERYHSVAALVRSIKGMGARNASTRRNRTPGVRRMWRRMVALYERQFETGDSIPATFEVIMGRGKRPGKTSSAAG